MAVIKMPNAIVDPWTMMVHLHNTMAALATVVGTGSLETLASLAKLKKLLVRLFFLQQQRALSKSQPKSVPTRTGSE